MNIAEPLLPACSMADVCDDAARGNADLRVAYPVSSAVQHRLPPATPPPALQTPSIRLHWIFHRVGSVLTTVAVPLTRAPFVFSEGMRRFLLPHRDPLDAYSPYPFLFHLGYF